MPEPSESLGRFLVPFCAMLVQCNLTRTHFFFYALDSEHKGHWTVLNNVSLNLFLHACCYSLLSYKCTCEPFSHLIIGDSVVTHPTMKLLTFDGNGGVQASDCK